MQVWVPITYTHRLSFDVGHFFSQVSICPPVQSLEFIHVLLTTVSFSVFIRKHDDDRRFVCTEEGCGKSFTRAEHLKGHSITHLGTKPFQCHAEGMGESHWICNYLISEQRDCFLFLSVSKKNNCNLCDLSPSILQVVMQSSQLAAACTSTPRNISRMPAPCGPAVLWLTAPSTSPPAAALRATCSNITTSALVSNHHCGP